MMEGHRFDVSRHLVSEMPAEILSVLVGFEIYRRADYKLEFSRLLGEVVFETYITFADIFPAEKYLPGNILCNT